MIDRKGWLRGPDQATAQLPFVNSLGMRFVPVPNTEVLFSVWETRKSDYARFANDNPHVDMTWKKVGLKGVVESWKVEEGTMERIGSVPVSGFDDHPVVCVSWEDAKAFCGWLTRKERQQGSLDAHYEYRLPTDLEWSEAVGLPAEAGDTPQERTGKAMHIYPWGTIWPPPTGAGNYMDTSVKTPFPHWKEFIEGYDDGFATTSPVGSFPANTLGIHDLGGNVWEWCEDKFSPDSDKRTLRGAAFNVSNRFFLMATCRNAIEPTTHQGFPGGFRVVLAPAAVKLENRQRAGDEADSAAYRRPVGR
jgi:formylglycine-generating enzyme required for sulfatase activity